MMTARARLELQAAEHFRRCVRADPAGWTINLRTNTVVWTPALYALLGLPLGAGSETLETAMALHTPDSRQRVQDSLAQAILADGGTFDLMLTVQTATGLATMRSVGRVVFVAGEPAFVDGYTLPVAQRMTA